MRKVKVPENWWPIPGIEAQGQYLAQMSDDERQATSLQVARCLVDIQKGRLLNNLAYPGDTPLHQSLMQANQSKCSLTVAAWMRLLGVADPLLDPPYYGRNDAHSRIEQVARNADNGCWGGHDGEFIPGDAIMIGTDVPRDAPNRAKIISAWGTPGHAAIVLEVNGSELTTVDGQVGRIIKKKRTIIREGKQVWLKSWTKRRIWGSIRAARLPFDPDRQWYLPKGPHYPGLT